MAFNKIDFINERPKDILEKYLVDYKSVFPNIDLDLSRKFISSDLKFKELTDRWYEHLRADRLNDAYSVYGDEYYFTDMWNCFKNYSRTYLKNVTKPNKEGISISSVVGQPKTVVDLGCGVGYCTAMLSQIFPTATVYATNLRDTDQWKFCEHMAETYNFNMVEDISETPENIDFVFASEYFEHIQRPIEHLVDIISKRNPKFFVIANAFNTSSIGHFETYLYGNNQIDQSAISKIFNATLRKHDYRMVKTGLFNNKPNFWMKVT